MVNCSLKACVEENLDMGLDSGVILLLLDLAESALAGMYITFMICIL